MQTQKLFKPRNLTLLAVGLTVFLLYHAVLLYSSNQLRIHPQQSREASAEIPLWLRQNYRPNSNNRSPLNSEGGSIEEILLMREASELRAVFEENCNAVNGRVPGLNRRLRVLFLTHYYHNYQGMMDRSFFHHFQVASNHPCIDAHLWGNDFHGYVNELHLKQNLINRFGSVYFDLIWISGIVPNNEIVDISSEFDIPIMLYEHYCRNRNCINVMKGNNVTLMMTYYAQDIPAYANDANDKSSPLLMFHNPHTARAEVFNAGSDVRRSDDNHRRSISVLLTGALDSSTYPIRNRLHSLITSGRIDGVVRPHPGYSEFFTFDERNERKITADSLEQQIYDYATQLRQAKICIVDSSIHKYALRNFIEAAQAGCLLIGSMPTEREEEFRRYMVEIPEDSDEKIISTINYWLTHNEERMQRAAIGQQIAVAKYDTLQSVTRIIQAYRMWKNREFGLVVTAPFRSIAS